GALAAPGRVDRAGQVDQEALGRGVRLASPEDHRAVVADDGLERRLRVASEHELLNPLQLEMAGLAVALPSERLEPPAEIDLASAYALPEERQVGERAADAGDPRETGEERLHLGRVAELDPRVDEDAERPDDPHQPGGGDEPQEQREDAAEGIASRRAGEAHDRAGAPR